MERYAVNYTIDFQGIQAYITPGTILQIGLMGIFFLYIKDIKENIGDNFVFGLCVRSMLINLVAYFLMFVLDAGVRLLLYFSIFNIFGIASIYNDKKTNFFRGVVSKSSLWVILYGGWIFYSMIEADSYGIYPYIMATF